MLKKGIQVFLGSMRFIKCYPICIVPLLAVWCVYAFITLKISCDFDFSLYSGGEAFCIVFGVYVLYAFLFGLACLILLELIQQIERKERPNLLKAAFDSVIRDFGKAIPVLLIWAVLWFLLVLLEALFSKKKEKPSGGLTAKSAVGTLLGADKRTPLSGAFFSALSKGVRMVAFLILPAIAWEDMPPVAAIKKGLQTLSDAKGQFIAAYGLTELFAILVLLLPAIIYKLDDLLTLTLPSLFWCIVLIYMAFATSLIFLVEQLYTAQLYLWHLNWENGRTARPFSESAKPEFFKSLCIDGNEKHDSKQ